MKVWIEEFNNVALLKVYLSPGASVDEVSGEHGEPVRLKIKVKARPVEGCANKALIKFLAKNLKINKSAIQFLRGSTSRNKDLVIDLSPQLVFERICNIAKESLLE